MIWALRAEIWDIIDLERDASQKQESVTLSSQKAAKTFLLGVGCQKGGTTWLHDYLKTSDQVDLGFLKEYHVFDALDIPSCRHQLEKIQRRARKLEGKPAASAPNREKIRARAGFYSNPESYFDYFQGLLEQDPGIHLTADITPSYAGLSEARLRFIKETFERRGIAVKAVFLMRDPVERIWSAIRMNHRKLRTENPQAPRLKKTEEALLLEVYDKEQQSYRTRYDATIGNLERVFAPEDILYQFYERLFDDAAVRGICAFLGIDFMPPDFGRRLNASPKSSGLSESAMRKVALHYRDTYEFVARKFDRDALEDIWPGMRFVTPAPV